MDEIAITAINAHLTEVDDQMQVAINNQMHEEIFRDDEGSPAQPDEVIGRNLEAMVAALSKASQSADRALYEFKQGQRRAAEGASR